MYIMFPKIIGQLQTLRVYSILISIMVSFHIVYAKILKLLIRDPPKNLPRLPHTIPHIPDFLPWKRHCFCCCCWAIHSEWIAKDRGDEQQEQEQMWFHGHILQSRRSKKEPQILKEEVSESELSEIFEGEFFFVCVFLEESFLYYVN